jgi:hypothetical protein
MHGDARAIQTSRFRHGRLLPPCIGHLVPAFASCIGHNTVGVPTRYNNCELVAPKRHALGGAAEGGWSFGAARILAVLRQGLSHDPLVRRIHWRPPAPSDCARHASWPSFIVSHAARRARTNRSNNFSRGFPHPMFAAMKGFGSHAWVLRLLPNKPLLQSPHTLVEGAHVLRHARLP